MSTIPPIRDALIVAETVYKAALAPYADLYKAAPAVYWRKPADGIVAAVRGGDLDGYIVCQSADGGGKAQVYLGEQGWIGDIIIRCMAATPEAASALLMSLPEPILLAYPGYTLRCRWQHPIDNIPVEAGIYTAAGRYTLDITHAS